MWSRRGLSYRGGPPDSRRRIGNRGKEIPMRKSRPVPVLLMFLFFFPFLSSAACDTSSRLKSIRLPPGFAIEIYAPDVPGARSMTLGERGTRFGGPGPPVVVSDGFPRETHHGWKFIAFGPEGMLYVPVGAPCNVCEREDPRFASIQRIRPDGTGQETFARGVRNTGGFDWDPATKELWFTDNGRDWLGDDLPPDELNHAPDKGLHFGFPYRHGKDIPDPEFGKKGTPMDVIPPAMELGPHVAALGVRFYTGSPPPGAHPT